jgi:hypothetical protein
MVGIYNKIKNGLNWLKGKALKYVAPAIGKPGGFAQSDFVQGVSGFAQPILNSFVPGLGTGINKGLEWLGSAGDVANGLADDYKQQGDNFGFSDMYKNVTSGKYTKSKKKKVPEGIKLSQRPDQLNDRIELKSDMLALMPPEDDGEADVVYGNVEEVD